MICKIECVVLFQIVVLKYNAAYTAPEDEVRIDQFINATMECRHVPGLIITVVINLRNIDRKTVGVWNEYRRFLYPERPRLYSIPSIGDFRDELHYNNHMYTLAGYVAEVIGGKTWEQLVDELLLTPLEMTSTGYANDLEEIEECLAEMYTYHNGNYHKIDPKLKEVIKAGGPSGSLCTTSSNMAAWMKLHINKGQSETGRSVVDGATLQETYLPRIQRPVSKNNLFPPEWPVERADFSYAMGWNNGGYRGNKRLSHGGSFFGYSALTWMFPDSDIGVFVAANGPTGPDASIALRSINSYIADVLLGKDPWLNASTSCSFPLPWKPAGTNATPIPATLPTSSHTAKMTTKIDTPDITTSVHMENFDRYIGVYGHVFLGNITIGLNETTNSLTFTYGRFMTGGLIHQSGNSFQLSLTGSFWWLLKDGAQSMQIDFISNSKGPMDTLRWKVSAIETIEYRKGIKWDELNPPCFNLRDNSCSNDQTQLKSSIHFMSLVVILVSYF